MDGDVAVSTLDTPHVIHILMLAVCVSMMYRHQGSFNIAHVKDSAGQEFATRLGNVFAIGTDARPWVSLPRGKGIKLSILEQRELREKKANN